jgi:hypothetical protein
MGFGFGGISHACIKRLFSKLCVNGTMQIAWQNIGDGAAMAQGWPSGPFQQSLPYAMASQALGARLQLARITLSGISGQALVMERHGLRLCYRGPVWLGRADADADRRALRRLARSGAGAGRLTLAMPESAAQGIGLVPLMTPRHVALWDLQAGEGDLLAAMQGKWRNRLRHALARGVGAETGTHRHLPDLVKAEAEQRRARGYRALPPAFTLALPAPDLRLWLWRAKGRVQAAMCFVRHGTWATYHMGHASPLAREVGAHGVMLWQAALSLRGEGVTTLDLGDVNTDDAPGLAHFKMGTGAGLHALGRLAWVLPG